MFKLLVLLFVIKLYVRNNIFNDIFSPKTDLDINFLNLGN